jgi:bifunctional DNase/RNase
MVNVEILDVIKEEKRNRHLILLSDEIGGILPIFVGASEAMAVAAGMKKGQFPRPMTHDMVCNLLEQAQVRIMAVDISSLREAIFYSTIRFKCGGVEKEVDARPSDAVALAVRLDVPIRVSQDVMTAAAITAPESDRLAHGMIAILKHIHEKMKQVASEKGWCVPEFLSDPDDIKVRSLLSDE